MAAIKSRDTKPEFILRRGLHALGKRYRLHAPDLPGRPDLVFRKKRAVIFVHGCFWHGHDCHRFKRPASNTEFWDEKIGRNRRNDDRVIATLADTGWRVLTVWECALCGRTRLEKPVLFARVAAWIDGTEGVETIDGIRPFSPSV